MLDPAWEESVEATFEPQGLTSLVDWDRTVVCTIPLDEQPYRVRYHARGMDAGNARHVLAEEEPVDDYLLVFWPAPPAPDRVLRQTAAVAGYWHGWTRDL